MPELRPQVAVVQDGARLHYAVPLSLQRAGALERLFVEWYAKPGLLTSLILRVTTHFSPGAGGRMRQRVHPEIDASRVFTNTRLAYREAKARGTFAAPEDYFAWASDLVGKWVARKGFGRADALFGFVRNISPELCAHARSGGLTVVADQMIAPMVEEHRQATLQAERFPKWRNSSEACSNAVVEAVEARTWAAAHHLTCGSAYVRDSLVAAGVSGDKVTVLPYPIDVRQFPFVDRRDRAGPVTVGMIGTLGLRKGTPYFLQVAGRLPSVRFSLVGPISVDRKLLDGHPNVTVVGPVPRDQVAAELAKFDVLLFPSTCEGSPGAVMEAMATGLPVVTTPTAGTVVESGSEGFVHPYDDTDALAASVERLVADAGLRHDTGDAAWRRAATFDLDGYGLRLLDVIRRAGSRDGFGGAAGVAGGALGGSGPAIR